MISASDRENAVLLINEAIASGASCKKACWTVWIVNFNTSHVTVYHNRDAPADVIEYNFNTSHVTVYRKTSVIDAIRYAHFNTSHVTVYLGITNGFLDDTTYFNTSHVTVYRCEYVR